MEAGRSVLLLNWTEETDTNEIQVSFSKTQLFIIKTVKLKHVMFLSATSINFRF